MPWAVERLNVKKSQPNANIVFIKPLKGSDEKISQDFLERIAAQCLPIMREHHLYVMSLEEFPTNREFVGRNFNAGEVIQLVLKSPSTGCWLPFQYVQMVMMHELAHCKQMNHSRAFWAVRNSYASTMQELWGKGYTGDGIWGRGAKLATGLWERDTIREGEVLPEHLCGGTYRSRRRKRKTEPKLSHQEQKQKRIEKKFGKNGVALGANDEMKVKLEKGKQVKGKPRVAGSARGRELRAAAALARFEQAKDEKPTKDEDENDWGSESEYDDGDPDTKDAIDLDGSRLVDDKGRGMIKVCEDDDQDPGENNEQNELRDVVTMIKREPSLNNVPPPPHISSTKSIERASDLFYNGISHHPHVVSTNWIEEESPGTYSKAISKPVSSRRLVKEEPTGQPSSLHEHPVALGTDEDIHRQSTPKTKNSAPTLSQVSDHGSSVCSICSFANARTAVTCSICANVLNLAVTTNSWQCSSDSCKDSSYRNSDDCGVCGLCGQRKLETT